MTVLLQVLTLFILILCGLGHGEIGDRYMAASGQRLGTVGALVLDPVQLQGTGQIGVGLVQGLVIPVDADGIVAVAQGAEGRGALAADRIQHRQRLIAAGKGRGGQRTVEQHHGEIRIGFALVFQHLRQLLRQKPFGPPFNGPQQPFRRLLAQQRTTGMPGKGPEEAFRHFAGIKAQKRLSGQYGCFGGAIRQPGSEHNL